MCDPLRFLASPPRRHGLHKAVGRGQPLDRFAHARLHHLRRKSILARRISLPLDADDTNPWSCLRLQTIPRLEKSGRGILSSHD